MAEIIVYATQQDVDAIRGWINADPSVAWIVKTRESGKNYRWEARHSLDAIAEQDYAIWHMASAPLTIPSGALDVPDLVVSDPFQGWAQILDHSGATSPWFGANLPGPFHFRFKESGTEGPGSLGRSGFSWDRDRYSPMGKPASPAAKKWWAKLKRFIEQNSMATEWAPPSKLIAYVFPRAARDHSLGRQLDINP
jgi:hypothetical protein